LALIIINIKSFMQIIQGHVPFRFYCTKIENSITWVFLIDRNFLFNERVQLSAFFYFFIKSNFVTYHLVRITWIIKLLSLELRKYENMYHLGFTVL